MDLESFKALISILPTDLLLTYDKAIGIELKQRNIIAANTTTASYVWGIQVAKQYKELVRLDFSGDSETTIKRDP